MRRLPRVVCSSHPIAGASWKKVDTGRNADKIDSGLIWSAVIDPTSSSTLYALTGYGPAGLWKTTNGGVDWDQIMPMDKGMPGFVARVNMDPTNSKHLIINFHDNCSGGHTPVCFGETQDGGTTWKVLDFPRSLKSGWGEGTAVMPIDATHWIYSNWELYYTSDSGSNWKDVTPLAATDVSFFRASNGKSYLGAAGGVSVTTDGATWSVIPNSGHGLDIVVGSSTQLFAIAGFGPPNPKSDFIWSANLSDPTKWSLMATPGPPQSCRWLERRRLRRRSPCALRRGSGRRHVARRHRVVEARASLVRSAVSSAAVRSRSLRWSRAKST